MRAALHLQPAIVALDACDAWVAKLHAGCCDPGRSPRMIELEEILARARARLDDIDEDPASAAPAFAELESAGGLVGRLQVSCCTPKRMPLYADILRGLTDAQLAISDAIGTGH